MIKFLDRKDKIDDEDAFYDLENHFFFSVRNHRAMELAAKISAHFAKLDMKVETKIDSRSITVRLYNPKKQVSWEYIDSYIWLKDMDKERNFTSLVSNFVFEQGKVSLRTYFPNPPKIVKEFWSELKRLEECNIFKDLILSLNYPFEAGMFQDKEKMKRSLRKIPEDFFETCIRAGEKAGKSFAVSYFESACYLAGFQVEANFIKEEAIEFSLINTKRGAWQKINGRIPLTKKETTRDIKDERVTMNIFDFGKIVYEKPSKQTVLFNKFEGFIISSEFKVVLKNMENALSYPFNSGSYLSC